MESPDDTCAVAAAIVGLTEGVLKDEDAVATVLKAEGIERERIGAVVRSLRPYADRLAGKPPRVSAVASSAPGWWRRLFG
jgi:hypothetical protein